MTADRGDVAHLMVDPAPNPTSPDHSHGLIAAVGDTLYSLEDSGAVARIPGGVDGTATKQDDNNHLEIDDITADAQTVYETHRMFGRPDDAGPIYDSYRGTAVTPPIGPADIAGDDTGLYYADDTRVKGVSADPSGIVASRDSSVIALTASGGTLYDAAGAPQESTTLRNTRTDETVATYDADQTLLAITADEDAVYTLLFDERDNCARIETDDGRLIGLRTTQSCLLTDLAVAGSDLHAAGNVITMDGDGNRTVEAGEVYDLAADPDRTEPSWRFDGERVRALTAAPRSILDQCASSQHGTQAEVRR